MIESPNGMILRMCPLLKQRMAVCMTVVCALVLWHIIMAMRYGNYCRTHTLSWNRIKIKPSIINDWFEISLKDSSTNVFFSSDFLKLNLFKCSLSYFEDRVIQREIEARRSSIDLFIPQIFTEGNAKPNQSQEPRTQSRSSTWVAGTQVLQPLPSATPDVHWLEAASGDCCQHRPLNWDFNQCAKGPPL